MVLSVVDKGISLLLQRTKHGKYLFSLGLLVGFLSIQNNTKGDVSKPSYTAVQTLKQQKVLCIL